MADFIRPTPQNPTLGAIARALSGVHEFAARPFGYANPPGEMLSELLGVPATARTVERLSYGEPLTTGAGGIGGTTRPREDTVDAALTVTPLAHMAGRAAGRGAMALGRAGERLAERAVPPIMERGGKGAELLQALGQGTTSNVVKPKGGNWVIGSVEKTTDPLKTRIGPTAFGMEAGSTDPARRIADLQASRAQNIEAGVPVDEERMAELMRLLEPKAAINRWLETKLGKYMRNEMGTPQDPLRLQADEFAAKREQLLAQKDAQIAKATADMEAARAARGFTPEMMTQSQARIRELQKERAFIEAQTGLHFEPEASAVRAHGKRHLAGMPTEPTSQTPYGMAWEDVADASILPGNYRDMTSMSDGRAMSDKLRELGGEFAVKNPTAQAYEIDRATSAQDLGFDHLMDELRNALDPNSGLPEKLRLSVNDIEKLTVPRAVKLVDEINAWRSVQQAEANKAIAGNAATQVIKEYPESGLKWVELKVPEQKKTELPTGWRVQKDVNSRGEDYYYVVNEQGEPFPGSGWIGDSPEKARANALEDLNKKDLEDALKYEGEMLKHCVGGYCPDVVSGKSRIMSLRDTEGRPRVTIEVQPEKNPYLSSSGNISDAGLQKIRSMFPESNFDLEYGEWFKNSDQHSMHFAKEYAPWIQRTYPEIYEATIGAPLKQNVQQIKAKSNAKASGADVEYVKDFLNSQPFGTVKDLPHNLVDIQDPALLPHYLKDITGQDSRAAQAIFNDAVDRNPNAPRFMTTRELRDFLKPPEGFGGGGIVRRAAKGLGEMVEKYAAKEAPQAAAAVAPKVVEETIEVLPKKEATKNLSKFVRPSAVKQRVYHGSNVPEGIAEDKQFASYGPESSEIHWFSESPEHANEYTYKYLESEGDQGAIFPVNLQIKKPLEIPFNMNQRADKSFKDFIRNIGIYPSEIEEWAAMSDLSKPSKIWQFVNTPVFRDMAKSRGYDGVKVQERDFTTWGAFEPTQIKSQFNRGAYDVTNPDPNYAGGGLVGLHAKYERGGRVRPGEGLPDPTLMNFQLYADTVSREMFPDKAQNPQRDAARHLLASALAAQKTTPGIAEFLGKAHEFKEAPLRTAGHWLGVSDPRADYPTDVHNNALGIQLGQDKRSLRDLLDAVEAAVRSGTPTRQPGRVSLEPDADTRYAEGGEVDAEEAYTPEERQLLDFYKMANRRNMGGTEASVVGTGANANLGAAGNVNAGVDLNRMSRMNAGRPEDTYGGAYRLTYGNRLGDVDLNATVLKPLDTEKIYIGMLNGSIPVGLGRLLLGLQGVKTPAGTDVTGHTLGWAGRVGPGFLSANVMKPRSGRASGQIEYQIPFAEGGAVDADPVGEDQDGVNRMVQLEQGGPAGYAAGGPVNYDPNEIDTIVSRVKEEFHG